jgi:hypothetical protein
MPRKPQLATSAKAKAASGMGAGRAARCRDMMADHDRMMAEMKSADERLDDLVAKMNAASGMEKADATAAIVSEMVTQRQAIRDGMMKMQREMMGHMMEHLQAGPDSMARCRMMKKIGEVQQ